MRNPLLYSILIFLCAASVLEACQSDNELNYARYYTSGKQLYDLHCQNCHNADGTGLNALIPPLTDTAFLKNNRNKLSCIIRHGLSDTISVNGILYSGVMPANHEMAEIDVAALVTYITNSFGNKQGLYDVSRAGTDLKNCAE